MEYKLALTMCSITGMGEAKKRAFPGVISAPPVNWAMRKAPPATGTTLSTISPANISQSVLFIFCVIVFMIFSPEWLSQVNLKV
jgi:hypothetical protein